MFFADTLLQHFMFPHSWSHQHGLRGLGKIEGVDSDTSSKCKQEEPTDLPHSRQVPVTNAPVIRQIGFLLVVAAKPGKDWHLHLPTVDTITHQVLQQNGQKHREVRCVTAASCSSVRGSVDDEHSWEVFRKIQKIEELVKKTYSQKTSRR